MTNAGNIEHLKVEPRGVIAIRGEQQRERSGKCTSVAAGRRRSDASLSSRRQIGPDYQRIQIRPVRRHEKGAASKTPLPDQNLVDVP